MGLVKFAALATIESWRGSDERIGKTAHRHKFKYTPRKGFIYVRSRAISSRMNDNYDLFPAEEIKKAWRTFLGKPVFVNHRNEDHKRARGVIIDAALHEDVNPDGTPDTWVEVLMEVDAVRFPKLAKAILAGEVDRTSMGTNVEWSQCTACGNVAVTPADYCSHIPRLKGMKLRRKRASGDGYEEVVIAEKCVGLSFFENSLLVEEPADPTAYFLGVDDSGLHMVASKQSILLHEKTPWTEEDEAKHPRKGDGEFTEKGNEGEGSTNKKTPAEGPAEGSAADAPASSTKWQSSNTTGSGTKADPISTDNVEDAARALIQGHHVNLTQPKQVSTLVDRLADKIREAKESGQKLSINLCNVTAKGTNIFCVESKGIPRIKMPQLKSGKILPGSRAERELTPNERGEYDLQPLFRKKLIADGVSVESGREKASHLKATQSELNSEKIAGMMDKILGGGSLGEEEIFTSNDDYIVDGHHRWAATVAADWENNHDEDLDIPIARVDMDIITLLSEANHFAEEWGIPNQGVTAARRRMAAVVRYAQTLFQERHMTTAGTASDAGWVPGWSDDLKSETVKQVRKRVGWVIEDEHRASIRHGSIRAFVELSTYAEGRYRVDAYYSDQRVSLNDRGDTWANAKGAMDAVERFIAKHYPDWAASADGPHETFYAGDDARSRWQRRPIGVKEQKMATRRTAYGEQVAPPEVDTLRDEECPVCGSNESYNGEKCLVCGYLTPPDMFQDPDLTKAQDVNLRQDDAAADPQADEALTCTTCGESFGPADDAVDAPEGVDAVDPAAVDTDALEEDPGEGSEDGMDLDPGDPDKKFPEGTHGDDAGDAKDEADDDEDDDDEDDDPEAKKKPPFKPKKGKIDPFERLNEDSADGGAPEIGLKAGDPCPKCGEGILEPSAGDAGAEPVKDASPPDQGSIEDARVGVIGGTRMAGQTLKALAAQQRAVAAQNQAILAIAGLAGLDQHPAVVALRRIADAENPAQPEPEPAAEAPVLVPSIPQGTTEVTTPGSSPVTDVAPDATTSLTDPGGVLTDVGPDATADVQAPVTGTQEGADNTVETEVVSETGDNSTTMFPMEGPFAQKASSLRQIASMRLARLRIQAGVTTAENDLTLASAIATSRALSDHDIETEIATLAKVVEVQGQRQASHQPRTAGVRSTPSLAGAGMPPVVAAEGPPGDDAFLFA